MNDKISLMIKVRFVAGALMLLFFGALRLSGLADFSFAAFAPAPLAAMLINQPYPFIARRFKNVETLMFINQTLDIAIITYGIHFAGGRDAFALVLAYPLIFIYSGLILSPARAYLMANLSFAAYAALVWAETTGVLEPVGVFNVRMSDATRLALVLPVLPLFNLIAFYASYLTGMLRKREAELREAKEKLEERVAARTAELADTNRRLAETNQELANFAAIASHDLKEPLGKAGLYAEMISENPADAAKNAEYSARILKSAHRMKRMIEDLLRYASIAGEEIHATPVSLDTTLGEVASDLEAQIREAGAEVRAGRLGRASAARPHVRQLLQNLVGNAIKYRSKDRKPVILVESAPARAGFIEIRVSDNGIGFDPAKAEKIFEPFERLHGRSEYEGAGLGLAICRKIALRYGGTIRAASEPGKGSAFFVTLPGEQNA